MPRAKVKKLVEKEVLRDKLTSKLEVVPQSQSIYNVFAKTQDVADKFNTVNKDLGVVYKELTTKISLPYEIKYKRLVGDLVQPLLVKAHPASDAGWDVFTMKAIKIKRHRTVKIPLGFAIELPANMMGVIHSKSGLSSKHGLICSNSPIDSGYRGEVHAIVTNTSKKKYKFNAGEKVGQLVLLPIFSGSDHNVVEVLELADGDRGTGAFGSTGK